ncbi:MAG: glutathione synthetase [Saprospiraceae bacterium]|nr:glutathione synthetase [Saprospiraceae bacterium]
MAGLNLLILTDHSRHTVENSLYALARAMAQSKYTKRVDVASRALSVNLNFFSGKSARKFFVTPVDEGFIYSTENHILNRQMQLADLSNYNAILLRMPPPPDSVFFTLLNKHFKTDAIVNRPSGIIETSSKKYLLQFPELCPPMALCNSYKEIRDFASEFPVVLKPLNTYGGEGVIRLDVQANKVWDQGQVLSFAQFERKLGKLRVIEYLAMKFLENVDQGDKRNIVVNRQLLGGTLRLPAKGDWLCNVSQGGLAIRSEPDEQEVEIANRLIPKLWEKGIVIFGFDTLVGDHGKRVLSELNTMSIGGITQLELFTGKPVVSTAAQLILEYLNSKVYGDLSVSS